MKTVCDKDKFSLTPRDQLNVNLQNRPENERLSDVPKNYLSPENLSKVQIKILSQSKLKFGELCNNQKLSENLVPTVGHWSRVT